MICWRDRSWCASSVKRCANESCDRYFGPKQQEQADEWWRGFAPEGHSVAPICFMDFETGCDKVVKTVRMLAPALVGLKCLEPYLDMTLEEAEAHERAARGVKAIDR